MCNGPPCSCILCFRCLIEDVVAFKQAGGSIVPTGEEKTVSSPSTQDVGLDPWNRKNKEQLAWRTPIIPIHQREQSSTSPHPSAFPGAPLIRSHSGVQVWDGGPLLDLSSDCSQGAALTHLNTLLVNSLSLSLLQRVSPSLYQRISHSSLK